jgi:predicted DNA-binding transcriptional regulator AlpA
MAEQLWRVIELAEFLNSSVANVYYLVERDRIPGIVRLGPRTIRFNPDVIRAWVEADRSIEAAR